MNSGISYTEPIVAACFLLVVLGWIRLRRRGRYGILLAALALLFLASWPPADWLLSRPLEARYPIRPFASEPVEAIVVLSASVEPPHYERPFALPGAATFERCAYAAWIHGRWPDLPVLVSGGGTPFPASRAMAELLLEKGVPQSLIWTEERSTSTYENALFGAEILKRHGIRRIALVVDAKSMPRAAACFRRQGITVAAAPSSFTQLGANSDDLLPGWRAVRRNEETLHETLGLAWYYLRGWI
jgi:uncharacterized SAM-binding protein YcdF (DUF218 family)